MARPGTVAAFEKFVAKSLCSSFDPERAQVQPFSGKRVVPVFGGSGRGMNPGDALDASLWILEESI